MDSDTKGMWAVGILGVLAYLVMWVVSIAIPVAVIIFLVKWLLL